MKLIFPGLCPDGATPIGACINGLCPTGYTCVMGQCCPGATNATFRCSNLNYVLGPCVGNQCPDAGFECDTSINSCCPKNDPVGPCIEPGNQCPAGYKCFTEGSTPLCYKECDGRGTKVGDPVNGVCPSGQEMIFGDCCSVTARFYNARPTSFLSDRHVDYFLPAVRSSGVGMCPDGTGAVSACLNGLCGHNYQCYNNLCCPAQFTNVLMPLYAPSGNRL
ncbi:unnamed protein product [Gongylonema pulchrum]|uniref:CC domain-containing protein n=1 Tax=Gongylonema pulchrum TaxID=637853 RepID=A0A183D033_9BILA|nr:unnamed protein product [Gongylonema pulchrum]